MSCSTIYFVLHLNDVFYEYILNNVCYLNCNDIFNCTICFIDPVEKRSMYQALDDRLVKTHCMYM